MDESFKIAHETYNTAVGRAVGRYQSTVIRVQDSYDLQAEQARELRDERLRDLRGQPGKLREQKEASIRAECNITIRDLAERRTAGLQNARAVYNSDSQSAWKAWWEAGQHLEKSHA